MLINGICNKINNTPQFQIKDQFFSPNDLKYSRIPFLSHDTDLDLQTGSFLNPKNETSVAKSLLKRTQFFEQVKLEAYKSFFEAHFMFYTCSAKNKDSYHGAYGILSEKIAVNSICLDYVKFQKNFNFKDSLCKVVEIRDTGAKILMSVSSKISNLLYKNNPNFKAQYKSICGSKSRFAYRHLKSLIPIFLADENEFFKRSEEIFLDINKTINDITKSRVLDKEKIDFLTQGLDPFEQNNSINDLQDPLISVTEDLQFEETPEDLIVFEPPQEPLPPPRYNLRKKAKLDYKQFL